MHSDYDNVFKSYFKHILPYNTKVRVYPVENDGANMGLKSTLLVEPIFVGRELELKELQTYLSSAIKGKGNTVFISGEAGTGKTRIINEFLKTAKEKKIALLSGWCLSNAAVPYFPFIQAFDSYLSQGEEKSESLGSQELGMKAWLTGRDNQETITPQTWKDQAFAAITKELILISKSKPTVLVLEDIQWADSASILLLQYISRAIGSEKILVLATFRSEELNVDAEGHVHPLAEVLKLMRREDLFKETKLTSLSQLNVKAIAENMLGGRVHPELIGKLDRESQGNPLFIVESLRMLHEHSNLVKEQDQWNLSVDNLGIPLKVKDIILRRLAL